MGLIQVPLLGCAVIRHLQKSAGLTLEEDIFILELHFTETQEKKEMENENENSCAAEPWM